MSGRPPIENQTRPMGMTAEQIAHQLRGRKQPSGWVARCPAHDDHNPSLSIREADGRILVHCHAGCEQDAVINALKARGLWRQREPERKRVVKTYDYRDEVGTLLYQVCRTEPKGFFQRRPDSYGRWIYKKSPRQVLYRLTEVLEAPIVLVVEGEKDVETLRSHGFVATTNAGGAKAPWLPSYTEVLRGREVILIPDDDAVGKKRVLTIARALLGKTAKVVILELGTAQDITVWFEQGHGELELIAQVEGQQVTS